MFAARTAKRGQWALTPKRRSMPTRFENANAVRVLAMDAVQAASSGHPGAPMGLADVAEVLWRDFLKHNPNDPNWFDRDRFVLSNGHGSMLLYALLHSPVMTSACKTSKTFGSFTQRLPGIRNLATRAASKQPPAHSVKALEMRSEWHWRNE